MVLFVFVYCENFSLFYNFVYILFFFYGNLWIKINICIYLNIFYIKFLDRLIKEDYILLLRFFN